MNAKKFNELFPVYVDAREGEFKTWMKKVDLAIDRQTGGLTSSDLPDYCYRDAFDDGASPNRAASLAIRAANE